MTNTAVAVKQEAGVPATYENFLQEDGAGFEYGSSRDYVVPRLSILQKSSAQVDDTQPEYVNGAKVGQFYVKGDTTAFDGKDGMVFVPVLYKPQYLEWTPKDKGGGLQGVYEEDQAAMLKTQRQGSKDVLPNGNHLQRHANIFGLLVNPETGDSRPFVMSLASTQAKYASYLYTQLKNQTRMTASGKKVTLPMFLNVVKMTTKPEQNQHGSWYSYVFERVGDLMSADGNHMFPFSENLVAEAKKFYEDVKSGLAKVDHTDGDSFDPETGEVSNVF